MAYEGQLAEMVKFQGFKDDRGEAYYARPTRAGRFPGVVVIHHLPGWDEWIIEVARKFAHHGYAAIAPHLYFRDGPGSPDDIGARVRAAGGVADEQVMGDVAGSIKFLRAQSHSNGKVGVIGFCSGGRLAYLAAGSVRGIDATVDCWGGSVIVKDKKQLDGKRPVAPIDLTNKITCPLLGILGNEDKNPISSRSTRPEQSSSGSVRLEFHRHRRRARLFSTPREGYRARGARRLGEGLASKIGACASLSRCW
jgi:carboxymethylenebutenolidase